MFSQTNLKAIIKDSKTKEPLSFCNVLIKGTNKGTITNIDGVFNIEITDKKSVLELSYLGYETKFVKAYLLIQNPEILLVTKDHVLQEVIVSADDDYLYSIMIKCRDKLLKNRSNIEAKVYYGLETDSKSLVVEYKTDSGMVKNIFPPGKTMVEQPVELLECFYNASLKGQTIEELHFKNGRTALCAADNYFLSLNSSKAFSKIILTENNQGFPNNPFQFGISGMKKYFRLDIEGSDETCFK